MEYKLNETDRKIVETLFSEMNIIVEEMEMDKKCSYISTRDMNIIEFYYKFRKKIKVKVNSESQSINFYYKYKKRDRHFIQVKYSNGYVEIKDPYNRTQTSHDTLKPFDMFLDEMKRYYVDPINQEPSGKLYKDILYKQFLNELN